MAASLTCRNRKVSVSKTHIGSGVWENSNRNMDSLLRTDFFGANAFDGQGDVAAGGIEKFKVALVVSILILIMLNDQNADGGVGSF